MQVVCTDCKTELVEDRPCPTCGAIAREYRYGAADIASGRISPPPNFFFERDDLPDWYTASGVLWADDDHQIGDGTAAYRAVFKTLRRPIVGDIDLNWPNLTVRFWHGSVKVGRTTVSPAIAWRKERHAIVPEWGSVAAFEDQYIYQPLRASSSTIDTQETEHTGGSFVEFILRTDALKPAGQVVEGRRTLASLITMIDLSLGPRVLGVQLTEEVGEVFPDGRFVCSGQSMSVGMESLLTVQPLFAVGNLYSWSQSAINRHMGRADDERTRLSLASEWFQLARSTTDDVLEFIYLWLVIEVIAMSTSNMKLVPQVAKGLATILGGNQAQWHRLIGRLFGTRSTIVHKGQRTVTSTHLELLRDVVGVLLEHDLGWVRLARREHLLLACQSI